MKILVIGGGGREHALVWKIAQSSLVDKIYCAPGNPGISELAECVDIAQNDIPGLLKFARRKKIDLTIVGPEDPLVAGIVDRFNSTGLNIFGPSAKAAEIEGSKVFTKNLLKKYNIPTANYAVFTKYEEARDYLDEVSYPTVLKVDGLAAGKGTLICGTREQAVTALDKIMVERAFGDSGKKVIIEEFMIGEEASVIAITDGENISYLPSAQDHKTIFDNDQGPNTGGMGAYAPAPVITDKMLTRINSEIMQPVVKAMALEQRPYRGVLYAGLMITATGPKVVEFNCRFGDPETQVLLPLVRDDLAEIMFRVASDKPIKNKLALYNEWAMCIIIASGGYPGNYEKGKEILGLNQQPGKNITLFHAGTKRTETEKIVTNGGRVLGVTARAKDFYTARESAYRAVGTITFDKAYYRKDIGLKAQKHLQTSNQSKGISL